MGLYPALCARGIGGDKPADGSGGRLCGAVLQRLCEADKVFRAPTDQERAAMEDLVARLKVWDGGLDAEALQSMVFAVGKEHGFEPLRDWFTALYEVLLGASQGPRFGGFIALYGVDETVALIEAQLAA